MPRTLYMVVEHFKNRDAAAVYRRFRDRGRMAPEGVVYVSSWIDEKLECCYRSHVQGSVRKDGPATVNFVREFPLSLSSIRKRFGETPESSHYFWVARHSLRMQIRVGVTIIARK